MWIYIVDMHFHILADVFFFDNMNYSSKLFNPTSFVIEPKNRQAFGLAIFLVRPAWARSHG